MVRSRHPFQDSSTGAFNCSSGSGPGRLRSWPPPRSPMPRRAWLFHRPSIRLSWIMPNGSIAQAIASFLAANGGALTADDFADHRTDVSPPLATLYRGYTVYETGLPTQGLVVLEALNICEHAPLAELGLR